MRHKDVPWRRTPVVIVGATTRSRQLRTGTVLRRLAADRLDVRLVVDVTRFRLRLDAVLSACQVADVALQHVPVHLNEERIAELLWYLQKDSHGTVTDVLWKRISTNGNTFPTVVAFNNRQLLSRHILQ